MNFLERIAISFLTEYQKLKFSNAHVGTAYMVCYSPSFKPGIGLEFYLLMRWFLISQRDDHETAHQCFMICGPKPFTIYIGLNQDNAIFRKSCI